LVFALTLAVLGGSAAVAGADAGANPLVTATVYTASGTSTDSVSVAELEANPGQCPTYQESSMTELGRQGPVDVPLAQNATWSLPTILSCLQTPISPGSVMAVTVIDADGNPEVGSDSQITPQDLETPSDFNNPSEYPVVQALGSVNQYDRPSRGSPQGQPDYDYLDEVQSSQPISIEVFEGGRLTVTPSASKTAVARGGTVSFSATVGGANGSPLSYAWSFDGGAPNSTAPAPRAAFNAAGQYDVTVQITDAAGAGGGAEIPITVGSAPPAATGSHHQTGGGTNRKSHSPTGPSKSGGQHAGAGVGKNKSQSTTSGKTTTTSTTPASTTPTSTSTTPASTTPTSTSTTSSHSATPSTPTPTTTTHSPAPHPPRHASPIAKPPTRVFPFGPLVAGQLISDVTTVPAQASPLVHSVPAPATSAPPARQAVRTSPLAAVLASLGVVLLLALGAARELRGRRGWRALRPGS
jgi:PKD domain